MLQKQILKKIVENFDTSGEMFADGKRNKIKLFEIEGKILNIKSFKKPIFINQIIYRYFRKSKAKRSFENAKKLLDFNIKTPNPIDYIEFFNLIGLQKSYYVCEHLKVDFTFLNVLYIEDGDEKFDLIKRFAKFTFDLHEKGIEFLDHSPGNTLYVKNGLDYDLYLVDLNRMEFHQSISFEKRVKNLSRIASTEKIIRLISDEYILHYNHENKSQFHEKLWQETEKFQKEFYRKKELKKKFLFWQKG